MASFDQKLRTLYLMEILLEHTDDEHMLNASELCTILDQEYGISTDRRTIYTEMYSSSIKSTCKMRFRTIWSDKFRWLCRFLYTCFAII